MTDPIKRSSDLVYLHPEFRRKVELVLGALERRSIPFEVFEASRSPERQARLYRKRPRVTKARPWRSMHQYGLAADFVLRIDGRWSWSTKTKQHRAWWSDLHGIASEVGLVPISWEKPHLQLAGVHIGDLRKGRYPAGGDDPWVWHLNKSIRRHPRGAPRLAEYDDDVCRPSTKDGLDHA